MSKEKALCVEQVKYGIQTAKFTVAELGGEGIERLGGQGEFLNRVKENIVSSLRAYQLNNYAEKVDAVHIHSLDDFDNRVCELV